MRQLIQFVVITIYAVVAVVFLALLLGPAHSATVRLGDCAVFPPAPVHVIHRPHHFAHHRAPVCHCQDELGGPAGSGASGDGFSFNGGSDNGLGFYQGDAGGDSFGGGDGPSLAAVDDLNFVSGPVFYYVGVGLVAGSGNGSPSGPGSPIPTVIPEPSTLALVALGAGALLLKWRVS